MDREDDDSDNGCHSDMDVRDQTSEKLDLNVEHDFHIQNGAAAAGVLTLDTVFESDEHAYRFYIKYAKLLGFRVRKDWLNRSKVHGQVVSRKFTCSKEGYRRKDKRDISVKNHRKETRTGCMAHMIVTRQPDGKYKVTQLEVHHNHDHINPSSAQTFLLQEELNFGGSGLPGNLDTPSSSVFKETSKRWALRDSLDSLAMDHSNHLQSGRVRDIKDGEAGRLMHYFSRQHFENPSFFYAVQLDSDDKVTNVFWADDSMIIDYDCFGDVICLDTTCRTNKDFQPFVQFIGLNNHNHVIVFAAAFLFDDTVESIKWLFYTFLEAVSGKKPKVILADQDAVIVEAINSVFPEVDHRICVWQMFQNALKHLTDVVKDTESFAVDFRSCIYDHKDEESFIRAWESLLVNHGLQQNEWLRWMLREKEKWALVNGCNTLFMDMENTHMGESLSNSLRKYLNSDQALIQFLRHFERVVDELRCRELEANNEMNRCMPKLMANVVLLKHASKVYTPRAYELFQREYERSLNIVVNQSYQNGSHFEYRVNKYGQTREYIVKYNVADDSVMCDCMKFEYVGFLCSHALKVLDHRNIKVLLSRYISNRWTREARLGSTRDCDELNRVEDEDPRLAVARRYRNLCDGLVKLSARAAESEEAFSFASGKVNEVIEGVEKILILRPKNIQDIITSNSNSANDSESETPEVFLDGNATEDYETEEIAQGVNRNHGALPDRGKLKIVNAKGLKKRIEDLESDSPNGVTSISGTLPPYVSPPSATTSHGMQNVYNFVPNHVAQSVYQQSNLVVEQQQNANMYPQSNFYPDQHESPNQTPLLKAMELDIQHPHPSFLLYDHSYKSSDGSYVKTG